MCLLLDRGNSKKGRGKGEGNRTERRSTKGDGTAPGHYLKEARTERPLRGWGGR